jgi:hypothetical protein
MYKINSILYKGVLTELPVRINLSLSLQIHYSLTLNRPVTRRYITRGLFRQRH